MNNNMTIYNEFQRSKHLKEFAELIVEAKNNMVVVSTQKYPANYLHTYEDKFNYNLHKQAMYTVDDNTFILVRRSEYKDNWAYRQFTYKYLCREVEALYMAKLLRREVKNRYRN